MVEFEKVDMDEFIAGCVQRFCPVCGKEIRQSYDRSLQAQVLEGPSETGAVGFLP